MGKLIYNKNTDEAMYKTEDGWKPSKIIENKSTGERMAFDGDRYKPIGNPTPNEYGFTDEVMTGATFGLSDRVGSAGKAFSDYVLDVDNDGYLENPFETYDKRLSERHMARDRYRRKSPKLSMGAGFLGGMGNPFANVIGKWMAGGKLAGSGLNSATSRGVSALPKQSLPQAMGRGAIGGAGMAGLQGFNEADGKFLDRLDKALTSAQFGGVLGAGTPAAVKGISVGYRKVADALTRWGGNKQQHTMALRKVAEAMEADRLNPEEALRKIKELGPEGALLDAGEASRRLAYAVYARPSQGSKDISDFLRTRQIGEREGGKKVSGQVVRTHEKIDDLGYGGYHDRSDLDRLQKEASELYEQAYRANLTIDSPEINALLRKIPNKIKGKARGAMNMLGENVSKVNPELTALGREQGQVTGRGIGEGLKLKYLDRIKRQLWDAGEATANPQTGRLTDEGRAYHQLRKQLTVAMDDADTTGFYKRARATAGDKLSNESARRSGVRFMLKGEFDDATTMANEIAEMSSHELHNFRMGVAQSLKRKLDEVSEGGNVTKHLLGKKNLEDRLEVAFGDSDIFERYVAGLKGEDEMYKAFAKMGGSQTATNEAAKEASRIDPSKFVQGFSDLGAGRYARGLYNLAGGVKDRVLMPPATANELGPILTGRNIQGLTDQYKAQELSRRLQNALSRGIVQGSSPLIGRQKRRKGVLAR